MAAKTVTRTLARRIPAAILVGLASATVLGGALGAAHAAGEPELPAMFGVPAIHEGDRMVYEITRATYDLDGTQREASTSRFDAPRTLVMEWMPAAIAYDEVGQPHSVRPLRGTIEWVAGFPVTEEVLFEMGTNETVAWRHNGTSKLGWTDSGMLGVGASESTATWEVAVSDFKGGTPFCGHFNSLQGAQVDPRSGVVVSGDCLPVLWANTTHGRFRATGIEEAAGLPAVRFDGGEAGSQHSLWFNREIPVPVQVRWHALAGANGDHILQDTARLVGFARGAAPYEAEAPAAPALPAVELSPTRRLGPDTADLELEYAWAEAWNDLRERSDVFSDWVDSHPNAIVALASNSWKTGENPRATWNFGLRDGDEALIAHLTRSARDDTAALSTMPPALPPALGGDAHDFDIWLEGPLDARQTDLAPRLPPAMPDVESVARAWTVFDMNHDDASAMRTWRYAVACLGDCDTIQATVSVGRTDQTASPNSPTRLLLGDAQTIEANITEVAFGDDGALVSITETNYQAVTNHRGLVEQDAAAPPAPASTPDSELVAGSVWWDWPSPAAAAGAGILGILVGVLYWLWPSIKSAPAVGLFSRLRNDQVLAHPARAQLMETLEAEPGLHHSELVRRANSTNTAVEHHLRILLARNLVVRRREAGYTCYFPARGVDRREVAALPWLRNDGARRVLEAVATRPGRSGIQLAAETGLDPATVTYHLQRLAKGGLVDRRRAGRSLAVHPTELGARLGGKISAA